MKLINSLETAKSVIWLVCGVFEGQAVFCPAAFWQWNKIISFRKFVKEDNLIQTWILDSKSTFQSLCLLPSRSCQATLRLLSLYSISQGKPERENCLIFQVTWVLVFCCLKFLESFLRECLNNAFCSSVLINVNRKKVYFLGTFKPAPSTWEVVTLPSRFEMLRSKCKLADSLWILLIVYPSLYFIHQKKQTREKNSSHFRFRFGKQVVKFTAQEFPELFSWYAKVCHVFLMYFVFHMN